MAFSGRREGKDDPEAQRKKTDVRLRTERPSRGLDRLETKRGEGTATPSEGDKPSGVGPGRVENEPDRKSSV